MSLNKLFRLFLPTLLFISQADTVDQIKQRGYLICGISGQSPGYSHRKPDRTLVGFDIDGCQALATAILGDPTAVSYVDTTMRNSFQKLLNQDVDILYRHTSISNDRIDGYPITFPVTHMIETQHLLVHTAKKNPRVCVLSRHNESNLSKHMLANELNIEYRIAENWRDAAAKLNTNYCDGVYAERSTLQYIQTHLNNTQQFTITEPLFDSEIGPVIRKEDERLRQIIQTLFNVQIIAEEANISSDGNAYQILDYISNNKQYNQNLGLVDNWQVKVIEEVGHYGEMFDRHFGPQGTVPLDRSKNHLWKNGGLMVSNL